MSIDLEDSSMWEFMFEVVSKGTDNILRWLPGVEVVDSDGQPLEPREYQPGLWNFLYSNHLYLAIFVNVLNNRINAIVTPRNPRPLPKTTRLLIRLPCFYLMAKSALVLLSRLVIGSVSLQPYFSQWVMDFGADYTDHQSLWLCLKALSTVYVMKAFHSSLENRRLPGREQSTTLYEYALLFHYFCNVSSGHSNTDLLLIAILEVIDIFLLEVLYLHPRGIQYRFIPTCIVGIAGIIHYAYALFTKSDTYPILQSFARFPELALIVIIFICIVLYVIAYVVTGGNVRRTFFLDAGYMPLLHEDYTMELYRIGTIVIETSRVDGFRNELPPIAVPLGTIFERSKKKKPRLSIGSANRRRPTCGFDNEQQNTNDLAATESNRGPRRIAVWSNFILQIIQVFIEVILWVFFWLRSLFHFGSQPVSNNNDTTPSNGNDGAEDIDVDEEIYQKFLREDLDDRDDEDDEDFTWTSTSSQVINDDSCEDNDSDHENLTIPGDELMLLGNDLREQDEQLASSSTSTTTTSPSSLMHSFFAHFMHTTTLTRMQYKRLAQNNMSYTPLDESAALMSLVNERRITRSMTSHPVTDRVCVVCYSETRQCLLKPCGCFALCNECRETCAKLKYKLCPCCRQPVEGYSRVYIP